MQRFRFDAQAAASQPFPHGGVWRGVAIPDPTGPYVLHEAAVSEAEDAYRRGYKQAITTLDAERAAREAVPE